MEKLNSLFIVLLVGVGLVFLGFHIKFHNHTHLGFFPMTSPSTPPKSTACATMF